MQVREPALYGSSRSRSELLHWRQLCFDGDIALSSLRVAPMDVQLWSYRRRSSETAESKEKGSDDCWARLCGVAVRELNDKR